MNKREIIKLLDKEVGLFREHEDENSLGELYITDIEFREAEDILSQIKRLRKELDKNIKFYKRKILKNEKGFYIKLSENELRDKQFNYDGDLIIIPEGNTIISNCVFVNKDYK